MFSRNHFSPITSIAIGTVATCLLLAATRTRAAEITLPPETARYAESSLQGYSATVAMCMTCHSADYTRTQPPNLPRAYWKATVVKMQKTFGAPVPDEAIEPIAEYLAKTYGAERVPGETKKERVPPASGR